jgi:hypothetical protein
LKDTNDKKKFQPEDEKKKSTSTEDHKSRRQMSTRDKWKLRRAYEIS